MVFDDKIDGPAKTIIIDEFPLKVKFSLFKIKIDDCSYIRVGMVLAS